MMVFKIFSSLIFTLIFALPLHGLASSKYGVVDMQRVILTVEEGKVARSQLEKEISTKEAELMKKKQELDKMNEDWKSQAPLLSEQARFDKQKEFQEKFMALRQEEMDFQKVIKEKEQKATQSIAMKVTGIVDNMAKNKKLEAVFESSSSGLLYLNAPVDLTPDVIQEYNKKPGEKGKERAAN